MKFGLILSFSVYLNSEYCEKIKHIENSDLLERGQLCFPNILVYKYVSSMIQYLNICMNVGNFSNKTDTNPLRFFIHGDLMQKTGFIYQEIRILYFMFHVKSINMYV